MFFGDASAVDSGARQAIDEANAASGSVSIYDIAQPSDLLGQNECIIGSQVTDNASLVGLCMEAVRMAPSAARSSTAPCRTVPCPRVPSATWCPPMFRRSIRLPGPDGGRQLYAVRFIPANHCGSIQMPGWSRFPPCPGNFCPTVERGLQCRALDGGQPLPSSLARRRKTAVRFLIARPFFRYSAPQERRGPPCSSGHQEREALSSRQSSGFFVWFL